MKIRNLDAFLDYLAEQRVWRLKEISFFRGLLDSSSSDPIKSKIIGRAFIPVAYAHWEGYVKSTAQAYIDFVACQKLKLKELSPEFQSLYFSIENKRDLESHRRKALLEIVSNMKTKSDTRVHLKTKDAISTRSNLNSDILREICSNIGISFSCYSDEHINFIDKTLIEKRNAISHGNKDDVTFEETKILASNVLEIIDIFRNNLDNQAQNKLYMRTP